MQKKKKKSSLISAMGCYKRAPTLNQPKRGPFTRTTLAKPTKRSESTAPTHSPPKNIALAHIYQTQSKNGHTYSHLPKEGHTNPNTPTITPQKLAPSFYHLYLQRSVQPEQTWILCILQIQFLMQKTDSKHWKSDTKNWKTESKMKIVAKNRYRKELKTDQ